MQQMHHASLEFVLPAQTFLQLLQATSPEVSNNLWNTVHYRIHLKMLLFTSAF